MARVLVRHGSTVEVRGDQVIVTHPSQPTVRLARKACESVAYGPITSAGQWLTMTPRSVLEECITTKVDTATRSLLDATATRLGVRPAQLVRAFIRRGLEEAEAARNA